MTILIFQLRVFLKTCRLRRQRIWKTWSKNVFGIFGQLCLPKNNSDSPQSRNRLLEIPHLQSGKNSER